jgi:hypothetical protein
LRHLSLQSAAPPLSIDIESFALAEKFNGNLGGRFLDSPSNLSNGVGQLIRVDIYSYATTRARHMLLCFYLPYRLFEVMSAAWALKFNFIGVNVSQ